MSRCTLVECRVSKSIQANVVIEAHIRTPRQFGFWKTGTDLMPIYLSTKYILL